MKIIHELEDLPYIHCAVLTIGFFDGFHIGHRKIIQFLNKKAKALNAKTAVFTFKNHPLSVISPDKAPFLISPSEYKKEFLSESQIDYLIMPEFTVEFSKIKAFKFLDLLMRKFGQLTLVVGSNFLFGHKNEGNISTIEDYAQKNHSFSFYRIDTQIQNGYKISSSFIRKLIGNGQMKEVNHLLNRDFFIEGEVFHGNALGREIGFPTANIWLPEWQIIPKYGVYSGKVQYNQKLYPALVYVSNRKLDEEMEFPIVESHLLNFHESIYDQHIRVYFEKYLREPIRLENIEDLKKQLELDKKRVL